MQPYILANASLIVDVSLGIAGGLVLILIEIFYKKHQLKRQRQMEVVRHAADKWRQTIQVSGKGFGFSHPVLLVKSIAVARSIRSTFKRVSLIDGGEVTIQV